MVGTSIDSAQVEALRPGVREVVAQAWTFRWNVEREASLRFTKLANRMSRLGGPGNLIELGHTSSKDEERHAVHCAKLAAQYGRPVQPELPVEAGDIAPSGLSLRQNVLYEVVAASCVTETVSTAVLSVLVRASSPGPMAAVLRELLRDEVQHSQLGWAYLSSQREHLDVRYLSELIPFMLAGAESEELFHPGTQDLEDPDLMPHGVLPISVKRQVFEDTLEKVVFPGLRQLGVEVREAQRWLGSRRDLYRQLVRAGGGSVEKVAAL